VSPFTIFFPNQSTIQIGVVQDCWAQNEPINDDTDKIEGPRWHPNFDPSKSSHFSIPNHAISTFSPGKISSKPRGGSDFETALHGMVCHGMFNNK